MNVNGHNWRKILFSKFWRKSHPGLNTWLMTTTFLQHWLVLGGFDQLQWGFIFKIYRALSTEWAIQLLSINSAKTKFWKKFGNIGNRTWIEVRTAVCRAQMLIAGLCTPPPLNDYNFGSKMDRSVFSKKWDLNPIQQSMNDSEWLYKTTSKYFLKKN